MSQSYQLTQHPVGSKREFWTLSWPLMLGLISSTLMMFVDRLFLARFDPLALNAAATSSLAYYVFLVIPLAITSITEVCVGRLHGEGSFQEIGKSSWQMVWFSLFLLPVFWAIGAFCSQFLFGKTANEVFETAYFQSLLLFASFQLTTISLSGFFIGIGIVRIVTITALLGNIINIILDYLLIFGCGPIPSFGVAGAAYATGISQIVQTLFLLILFLNSKNRATYKTNVYSFHKAYFFEALRIGVPAGLARCVEVIAHFLFYRIVMMVGQDQLTITTMVQTLFIFFTFITEAENKATTTIVANLLGAKVFKPLNKVLRSSFILHGLYFIILSAILFFFSDSILLLFSSENNQEFITNANYVQTFSSALFFMSLYFLFDGLSWILIGFLTAAGDARFVLLVSILVHWIGYVLPTYWFVGICKNGADIAWGLAAFATLLNAALFLWRYRSGFWLISPNPKLVTA